MKKVLLRIKEFFAFKELLQTNRLQSDGHAGPRLYRAFDGLDHIFKLDYDLEEKTRNNPISSDERLYSGSGVGVQSGYSTILLALHHLDPVPGCRMVDLGSGYGRGGLVSALLAL